MAQAGAKELTFELVSPERVLASETVEMVIIPGTEGYFAVMAGHAPFLSSLKPGVIEIRQSANDSKPRRLFVSGGVSDVNDTVCTVLATDAIPVDELDRAKVEQKIADLQDDISRDKTTEEARKQAALQLGVEKAKLQAITGVLVV